MQSRFTSYIIDKFFIFFVLLSALIRFYRLDIPAMWWDEILVPLTASHSWEYIVSFSLGPEMHPPYYAFLVKLLMYFSSSEFFLRSISALAGTATVAVVYFVGKKISGYGVGLIAASVMMANPYMIWLSRQVRPYALLLLSISIVMHLVSRQDKEDVKASWLAVAIMSGFQLLLHYVSIFLVFSQALAISVGLIFEKKMRVEWKRLSLYFAVLSSFFLAIIPFFYSLLERRKSSFVKEENSYSEVFTVLKAKVIEISQLVFRSDIYHIELFLIAFGAVILFLTRKRIGFLIPLMAIVPLSILYIFKDTYVYFWHISFLIPTFSLMFSVGVCFFIRHVYVQMLVSLAVSFVLLFNIYSDGENRFYSVDSHSKFAVGPFSKLSRPATQEFLSLPFDSDMPRVVYSDSIGFINSVSWYLDRFTASNPLMNQSVTSSEKFRNVWYIANDTPGKDSLAPKENFETYVGENLYKSSYVAKYKEFVDIFKLSSFVSWDATPLNVYTNSKELSDITIVDNMGPSVVPTKNMTFGSFVLEAKNHIGTTGTVFVDIKRVNAGRDNIFKFLVGYDDHIRNEIYGEVGKIIGEHVKLRIETPEKYDRIAFEYRLLAADRTADYEAGNQQTIKLQNITFLFDKKGLLFDLLKPITIPNGAYLHGIEGIERDDNGNWRWINGSEANYEFDSLEEAEGVLRMLISNPIPNQNVAITVNGSEVANKQNMPYGKWLDTPESIEVPVRFVPGKNQVKLIFGKWNHRTPEETFSLADPRPLSAALLELSFNKY